MAANAIATGAVVLVASADKMVAGLDQAKARVDQWGKQTEARVQATAAKTAGLMDSMRARWAATESQRANSLGTLMANSWGASARADHVARSQAMLANIDAQAKRTSGSVDGLAVSTGALAGKFGTAQTAGAGLLTTLASFPLAAFTGAIDQATAKFNRSLAEFASNDEKLAATMDRIFADQRQRMAGAGFGDAMAGIDAADKSAIGAENHLNQLRRLRQRRLDDLDRFIGDKSIVGSIPGFKEIREQEIAELEEQIKQAQRRYEMMKKQAEALKASAAFNLLQSGISPVAAGIDQIMGKISEFGNRVVANNKSILDDRRRMTEAIDSQLKGMEREAQLYGLNATQAKRMALELDEANAEQLWQFDRLAEHMEKLKQLSASAAAPRLASAIEAGTADAFSLEQRLKGYDIGDGNAAEKANGQKLDEIKKLNEEFLREYKAGAKSFEAFLRSVGVF